ncbi:MAG TPA: 2-phospho-L-lactate transferase CofD family protein [Solirubrobacterales bacterium]|nr:2-phospho-L-lactate transferase CofD family protein [Solirubrobacterales bacterium]
MITLLAGGTGGAKLACGLRDLVATTGGELNIIANTGDDIEIYDAYVSPDPDLITYRLAGALNEMGFGIEGESHDQMDRRRAEGKEIWFELGDRDLDICRERSRLLAAGADLTEAHAKATAEFSSIGARVLPMSHEAVRTVVETPDGSSGLQEYMIRDRCEPEITGVRFEGIDAARPSPQVEAAIAAADLIVIGPSNPVISIGPILGVPGMGQALADAAAPVVAVSPFVRGEILKGPTAKFMTAAGTSADSEGVAKLYGDVIDGFVSDEEVTGLPVLVTDVLMDGPEGALRLAAATVEFGRSLKTR